MHKMLRKRFLATDAFYAHQEQHLEDYLRALDEILAFVTKAIKDDNVAKLCKGSIAYSGFYRLA